MTVFNCGEDLAEEPLRLRLLDASIRNNMIKELATRCILHNDPNEMFTLININDTYNVRMMKQLHKTHFPIHAHTLLCRLDICSFDDFNGDLQH